MASEREDDPVTRAVDNCSVIQSMIDFSAKHLVGLWTTCATQKEITQKEIKESEGKLIKLFSKQLVAKAKLKLDEIPPQLQEFPKTQQWLKIIGIDEDVISGITLRDITLETLLEMTEDEVAVLLQRYYASEDNIKRLNTALHKLKICTERQLQGEKFLNDDLELHWTSYSNTSPFGSSRPSTSSLPPDVFYSGSSAPPTPPQSTPSSPAPHNMIRRNGTPPPTPPAVRIKGKAPATPPPKNKIRLHPDGFPLQKSKSHESQLFNRVDTDGSKHRKKPNNLKLTGSYEALFKRRLSGEESRSGHTSPLQSPPYKHDDDKSNTLLVPKSPKTPVAPCGMSHAINHRFENKFVFGTCDYCRKNLFELRGKMCKYCKFKCHRDCAQKAAPACGLPDKLVDLFIDTLREGSPSINRKISSGSAQNIRTDTPQPLKAAHSVPAFQGPDSSSNTSSCNSSTPSSPAFAVNTSYYPNSPKIHLQEFHFPDVSNGFNYGTPNIITIENIDGDDVDDDKKDVVNTNTSNDSDKTIVDSVGSGDSAVLKTLPDRVDSLDDQSDIGQNWQRQNSISVALREWDIPFEELERGDRLGAGRFGTVHKGNWHGDVAIKMLNMENETDNEAQLSAFKQEVAMLRKTRHDNLVLFMGACMKPPHLAIVTSLCKGSTLYTYIHARKEKFSIHRTVTISSQIAQGMGYLHAKGIVHKDLKSKNIFLEVGKVIITDFGLFNATKLCHGNRKGEWLSIPPGWLCYLAPEIIRSLHAGSHSANTDLPFTEYSDVYAFGTVWYELLSCEWPFKDQPPEAIIWQVGKGLKQSLGHIQASRDVKDILMMCWAYKPNARPEFSRILKTLEKLPKKRLLTRSPSDPIQLSRSAESVF